MDFKQTLSNYSSKHDGLLAFTAITSTAIATFSLIFSITRYTQSKKEENNIRVANLIEKFQNDSKREMVSPLSVAFNFISKNFLYNIG